LQTPGLEAVVNPTPIHLHETITSQCLSANVQVWLEKPAVPTIQAYDRLVREVSAHGMAVPVCFNALFTHQVQRLKAELVAGKYGRIRRIKGLGAWTRPRSYFTRNDWAGRVMRDGQWILDGSLNNALSHLLSQNLFFGGPTQEGMAELEQVTGEVYRCNPIEGDDLSCSRLVTRQGFEILTYTALVAPQEIAPITVIETDRARIHYEDFSRVRIFHASGEIEERESYQEHRIEMILHLCRAFRTGGDYLADLRTLRPFTEAVNGVFDSAGGIHTIPADQIVTVPLGADESRQLKGLNASLEDAFARNALFSELATPWAVAGEKLSLVDYARFPKRFTHEAIAVEA
jgi:predicted dehydrogenase